jgi:hypothetical protein
VISLKKHLSVSNVVSCLALFLALTGAAYAASLGKGSVKSKNIAKGAVTSPKLKNGAVTSAKLANGAVITAKLANGSVFSAKVANGAIVSAKLGGGAVTSGKIADGSVIESKLATNSVTGGKIANNAVSSAKLANGSVATGKLAKEAVTGEKLAPALLGQLVRNVTYVTETSANDPTDSKTVTATCPTGRQVTGGGARVTGANTKTVISESAPFISAENKRTGWVASAREVEAEASNWAVVAYAICAEL